MSPECLENSKIVSILGENLTFRINDLFNLKEISKLIERKSELIEILEKLPYIRISDDKETAAYKISENFVVFSILNIPQKMTKTEILKHFDLMGNDKIRLFKKCLFWILSSSDDKG